MELNFDLAEDEFPIFMAETDEQLQVLDDGLIRLEREGEDMELLQALFRAAHTLKGTSYYRITRSIYHSWTTAFGFSKHTYFLNILMPCLEPKTLASLRKR
jgi:two-component system chemotaxis sensor kinase CheA